MRRKRQQATQIRHRKKKMEKKCAFSSREPSGNLPEPPLKNEMFEGNETRHDGGGHE